MKRITIHEHEKVSVWCYPDEGIIHHQIHSYCCGEPWREAMSVGTDALVRYRASKWLSDDRKSGPLSPEDERWAGKVWFRRTRDAGWKHWALVLPHAVVGKMFTKRFIDFYCGMGVNARMFSDIGEATRWIRQPGPPVKTDKSP